MPFSVLLPKLLEWKGIGLTPNFLDANHNWDFDTLVIDELSSFKSSKAQRFRALKRVRPRISRVIGLTGTPQPNGLLDLWPQMYLLDMGQRLGSFAGGYRERFFLPDKRNREVIFSYKPKDGAEEKIYELISDICISMKATDYLDMPELVSSQVEVKMSAMERKLYEDFERDTAHNPKSSCRFCNLILQQKHQRGN